MPPCIEIVKVFVFTNTVTFLLPHTWVGGVYVCIVGTLISFLLEDKTKDYQRILIIRFGNSKVSSNGSEPSDKCLSRHRS